MLFGMITIPVSHRNQSGVSWSYKALSWARPVVPIEPTTSWSWGRHSTTAPPRSTWHGSYRVSLPPVVWFYRSRFPGRSAIEFTCGALHPNRGPSPLSAPHQAAPAPVEIYAFSRWNWGQMFCQRLNQWNKSKSGSPKKTGTVPILFRMGIAQRDWDYSSTGIVKKDFIQHLLRVKSLPELRSF
jgi:hypothetical protein